MRTCLVATKNIAVKIINNKSPRILPIPKNGGVLSLIPTFGDL